MFRLSITNYKEIKQMITSVITKGVSLFSAAKAALASKVIGLISELISTRTLVLSM